MSFLTRLIKIIAPRIISQKYSGPPQLFGLHVGVHIGIKPLVIAGIKTPGIGAVIIYLNAVVPAFRFHPTVAYPQVMIQVVVVEQDAHVVNVIFVIGKVLREVEKKLAARFAKA